MPAEYKVIWTTASGGTGYSTFHFDDCASTSEAQTIADSTRAMFNTLIALFPNEVAFSFDTEVINLSLSGTLTAVYSVVQPTALTGTDGTAFNPAAGLRIDWTTGAIIGGRRLTGRTYLVPTGSGAFDATGHVNSATVTAVATAANTFRTAVSGTTALQVFSRRNATSQPVSGVSVPTKGAILRGRRD